MDDIKEDIKYWVALNRIPQLGTVRFCRLEDFFGGLENAWNATISVLKAAGIEDRPAQEIAAARNHSSPDEEMDALARAEVLVVSWNSELYPARLKQIPDPPPIIYYKGTLLPSNERAVAVVGTRNPTSYERGAGSGPEPGSGGQRYYCCQQVGPGHRWNRPPDGSRKRWQDVCGLGRRSRLRLS